MSKHSSQGGIQDIEEELATLKLARRRELERMFAACGDAVVGGPGMGWDGRTLEQETAQSVVNQVVSDTVGCGCAQKQYSKYQVQITEQVGPDHSYMASGGGYSQNKPGGVLSDGERQYLLRAQIKKERDIRSHMLEMAKQCLPNRAPVKTHTDDGSFKRSGLLYNTWTLFSDTPKQQGCCPAGVKVTEAFNAGYTTATDADSYDPGYPSDGKDASITIPGMAKYPGMAINGLDVNLYSTSIKQYFGTDLAHDADPYVWTKAPEALLQFWPGQWDFDDPSCNWLYMSVGQSSRGCTWPNALNEVAINRELDRFLVSALMPYAVYDFRNISGVRIDGCTQVVYRIRYWVGVTHHFSFFLPHSYDTGGEKSQYTIDDLPPECWDDDSDSLAVTGVRVDTWMKMGFGCTALIEASGNLVGREYFCDASQFLDSNMFNHLTDHYYYNEVYVTEQGPQIVTETSACCFSNHTAYMHNQEPWRSMTSLLGMNLTGEVCFTLNPWEVEQLSGLDELVIEGFRILFGSSSVKIIFENQFWGGPNGTGVGQDYTDPHSVFRRIYVNDRMLTPVYVFCNNIYNMRATSEGKWLFRSWDADRLLLAAQDNENDTRDDDCCP